MKLLTFILFLLLLSLGHSQEAILNQEKMDSLAKTNTDEVPLAEIISIIENVPVYPGCAEKESMRETKKCMSQKIALLYKDNFNTVLHEESYLEPGRKRIFVTFKVDKEGLVTDIQSKGPDEYIEAEATRVAKLIPQMKPGYQRGKPVIVPFSLPLLINMTANKDESNTRYPVYRGCDTALSNEELEACSKEKISNFIKMSFDIEKASRALPTDTSTQFLVEFTITKDGKIDHVNAKANHKAIAIEAIKVVKRLPKFKAPGLSDGVAVDTPFSMLMTLYFN